MMKKSPKAPLVAVLLAFLISGAIRPAGFQAKETKEIGQSQVVIVSAASFNRLNIAPGSIVAAFGQKLANTTAAATDTDPNRPGVQLPTVLGGARVKVQGQNAELLFVSPDQINFVVPEFLALLQPTVPVEIIPGDGPILTTEMAVSPVSPAIFTADSSGGGLPAATVLRVRPDGTQVNELLYRRDASGAIIPIPVDLGPAGEKVFLILFLTGIRHATGPELPLDIPANVSVRVIANGYSLKPSFAGPQGDFAGLDQINVELPRALLGDSMLNIAVTAINEEQSNRTEVPLVLPQAVFTNWAAKGLPDKRVNSLGANGETVVAGAPMEIFRSTDKGTNWTLANWGFPAIRPNALAFATTVTGLTYAATERHGAYVSPTYGRDWLDTATAVDNQLVNKRVFSIAANRRFVFAGSDGLGVFRRDVPCCSPWTPFNTGLANLKITALATRGNQVFAGTLGGGIFISPDNGGSWRAINQGLPANAEISTLALGDNGVFAGLNNGIYRSTDGGANWSRLTSGLPANPNITSLLAHGPNVFAGIQGAGVYLSTDSGATWRAINQGLTNPEVLSLLVNDNILYAGTTAGVFATTIIAPGNQPPVALSKTVRTDEDTPLMVKLEASAADGNPLQYEITIEPRNGSLITSGANMTYIPNDNFNGVDEFIFRATNGQIGSRPAKVTIEIAAVNDPPKVNVRGGRVAIAGQFVPLQVDVEDPDALRQPVVTANSLPAGARFDPASSRLIWVPDAAGSHTFSFTATDDGNPPLSDTQTVTVRVADNPEKAAWSQLSAPNNLPVYAVFADGNDIYATTFNQPGTVPVFRLFKSVDQGATWTPADTGLTGAVQSIERAGAALFAATNDSVYRSTDNGANWASASGDLPHRDDGALVVTALTTTAGKVFVATTTGIFVTTDQGARWTNITGDLPYPSPPGLTIPIYQPRVRSLEVAGDALFASIEFDPFLRSTQTGAESQLQSGLSMEQAEELTLEPPRFGVFRTTNNGMNWVAVNNGLRDPRNPQLGIIVRRVAASGTRLYALTSPGLFFSNNQGASWTPISSDLTNTFFGETALLYWPALFFVVDGDNLYLALQNRGLYLSRNNGADWLPINIGLPEDHLLGAAISNSKIFAATLTGKLYVRTAM